MIFSPDQIIEWILVYRYVILFPIMVFEGPIITIIAGFIASLGLLNIYIVYLLMLLADLTGDVIYYSIGRWGRKGIVYRINSFFGLTPTRLEKLENHFSRHQKKTIILGKLLHAFSAPTLIVAGLTKMPFSRFIALSFIAAVPNYALFAAIGYFFGSAYVNAGKYLNYFNAVLIIVAVLAIIAYLIYTRFRRKFERITDKISKKNPLSV